MSMTVTQTVVEERLQPVPMTFKRPIGKVIKPPLPTLLRSSSFDRLKQFPSSLHAYFCQHGSAEILKWLTQSRTRLYTTVSELLVQLRSLLLVSSVFAAVGLVSIQLVMCLLALATVALPTGLAFLLTCIIAMAVIAVRIILTSAPAVPQEARRSRSRTRHVKQE